MFLTKQTIRQKLKQTNCKNSHLSQIQQSCSKNQHNHIVETVIILHQRQKWQHLQAKNQREVRVKCVNEFEAILIRTTEEDVL